MDDVWFHILSFSEDFIQLKSINKTFYDYIYNILTNRYGDSLCEYGKGIHVKWKSDTAFKYALLRYSCAIHTELPLYVCSICNEFMSGILTCSFFQYKQRM